MTPKLPEWVLKRDGRREPFNADKISEALFAATEANGSPNAFLARELTDGVLHFLGHETEAETIATGQIAEVVEKVVRELGQPELAQRYRQGREVFPGTLPVEKPKRDHIECTFSAKDSVQTFAENCIRAYSLLAVFSRDIAAAHAAGYLSIADLHEPEFLEAAVIDPPGAANFDSPWMVGWSQVRDASRQSRRLVVDNPELMLAAQGNGWLEGFTAALDAYDCTAHFNLQPATPPNWTKVVSTGPLFAQGNVATPNGKQHLATIHAAAASSDDVLLRWHLQAADFEEAQRACVFTDFFSGTQASPLVIFVLDRTRKETNLWRAVDRSHPAVLTSIGLLLFSFLQLPEIAGDAAKLLAKLPSLVRMAASAGVQKRNYLRKHCPALSRGFLLDRARLVIEPFEVREVVRQLTGASPAQSSLALRTACQILEVVRDAAQRESRATGLEILVSGDFGVNHCRFAMEEADAEAQQHAAGAMLNAVDTGALTIFATDFVPESVWSQLSWTWRQPHIPEVQFCRVPFDPSD